MVLLAAETRKYCNECRFLDQHRRRLAISLSKTALEARFGALEREMRCLSEQGQILLKEECPKQSGLTTGGVLHSLLINITDRSTTAAAAFDTR